MWATRGRWFRPSAHSGTPDGPPRKSCAREPARPTSETVERSRRGELEETSSGGPVARGQQDYRPRVHPNPSSDARSKPARPAGGTATGASEERSPDAGTAAGAAGGAAAPFFGASSLRGKGSGASAKGASKRASARDASASGACLGGLVDLRTLGSARGGAASASGERKALASFRRQHMMRFLGDANLLVLQLHGKALCCGRSQAKLVDEGDEGDEEDDQDEEDHGAREAGEAGDERKGGAEEQEEETETGDDEEDFGLDEAVSSLDAGAEEGEGKEKAGDFNIPGSRARGGATGQSEGSLLVASEIGSSRDGAPSANAKPRDVTGSKGRATPPATPMTTSMRLRSSQSRWEQVLSDWAASARLAADEVAQGHEVCEGTQNEGSEQKERTSGASEKRESATGEGVRSLEALREDAISGAGGCEVSQVRGTASGTEGDRSSTAAAVADCQQLAAMGSCDGRTACSDDDDRRTNDRASATTGDAGASRVDREGSIGGTGSCDKGVAAKGMGGNACVVQSEVVVGLENRERGDEKRTGTPFSADGDCTGGNSGGGVDEISIDECKRDKFLKVEAEEAESSCTQTVHADSKVCQDDVSLRKGGAGRGAASVLRAPEATRSREVRSTQVEGESEGRAEQRQRKDRHSWLKYHSLCGVEGVQWNSWARVWGRRNCRAAS
ncbi:hypothetical protein CLOM_g15100 [Closterium sp. NIES-68]|nr:hypothetical protein CLOM_g15100 [Closterium sp. NIES-68]GJP59614.1 hypothetical protein CLOP_g13137 [Closterium sp. NIES-67]